MERMTFDDAVITCTDMRSRVAVPTSLQEQIFIWELVNAVDSEAVYIGCTDKEEEGKWLQPGDGGEECSFFNWYPGEPNNAGGEDCAFMNPDFNGRWSDNTCIWPKYVVCQRPAVAPTDPQIRLHCLQADTNGHFASHCLTGHVIE
ncbi:pulmonary surfactant-associated protein D-like [Asterias amurensis]|uniref:pulmonary surfactant-associated protein D-like n=1 Tax=Asterias amurensis TaxID=7602 RepID=UPI003AB80713